MFRQPSGAIQNATTNVLSGDFWRRGPQRRKAALILAIANYANLSITIAQGLLLVPLYIHYLGTRLYGLWLATGGVLGWLTVLDLGIASLVTQRVARACAQRDADRMAGYFFNGLVLHTGLMTLLVICGATLAPLLPEWFRAMPQEAGPLRWCFVLAAISIACSALGNAAAVLSQALQRPLLPGLITIGCSLAGLLATITFLMRGWWLFAIPAGLLARNLPLLFGNVTYSIWLLQQSGGRIRFDREVFIDIARLSPTMFASRFGSSMVGQIEPSLIALFLQPELSVAFVVTKRVADIVVMLLDTITAAIFPGFAHLYAGADRDKAGKVVAEIFSILSALGLVCLGAYVAGNGSFITLWVGETKYAGQTVTTLIAAASFFIVFNNLLGYLLNGAGDMVIPCLLILAEGVCRLGLMIVFLLLCGLSGLPLATIITTAILALAFVWRLSRKVPIPFFLTGLQPRLSVATFLCLIGALVWLGSVVVLDRWVKLLLYIAVLVALLSIVILIQNNSLRTLIRQSTSILTTIWSGRC